MKKMTVLVVTLVILLGCDGNTKITLKDYIPKSRDEEAIKTVLLGFENAWNRSDIQGILDLMHEKAKLMTGMYKTIVSKKDYANILPQRMPDHRPAKLYQPTVIVKQDKATVEVVQDMGRYQNNFIYQMVWENDRWFILSWEY